MSYNELTNFGENPNGQEAEIKQMLEELDDLKALRVELKYPWN